MTQNLYIYFTLIATIAFIVLRLFDIYYVKRVSDNRTLRIKLLETQIEELTIEVQKLRNFIDFLLDALAKSNIDVPNDFSEGLSEVTQKNYYREVLLVCGNYQFCETDRRALRKAQIPFIRLQEATVASLKQEILRRRADGNLYRIVHFAAHGNENYIELSILPTGFNDKVGGDELGLILSGVEVVFLNACESTKVGDKIADIVPVVITLLEEIEDNVAEAFTTEFYTNIRTGSSPLEAFYKAINTLPEISEFAHIRVRN